MLRNKKPIILFLLILVIVTFSVYLIQNNKNSLKFSNTSYWGDDLILEMEREKELLDKWDGKFDIPLPPKNNSKETKEELRYLLELKPERTEEKTTEIESEAYNETFIFAGRDLYEYFDRENYPETHELYEYLLDISTIVLQEKESFDRVRPHILEPDLEPIVEVPKHPAYPSGHATQAYFLAELLSLLDEDRKEEFFNEAYRVAHNREIAGVHYPSDSEAGKILANQYINILTTDKEFLTKIEKAKEEWK